MFTPLSPNQLASRQASEQLNKKVDLKKTVVYVTAWLPAFALVSATSLIPTQNKEYIFLFMQVLYLVMGIVHVNLLYKYLPHMEEKTFKKGFLLTLLMIVLGFVVSTVLLRFTNRSAGSLLYPSSLLLFPIPYLVKKAFDYFYRIPGKVYKQWYYPLDVEAPDRDFIDLSVILIIQLELSKKNTDSTTTTFSAKAPLNMPVGLLFQIFINDYNERNSESRIEYVHPQKKRPYGWVFYTKKGFFKKKIYLDPDITFRENKIVEKEHIFVERQTVADEKTKETTVLRKVEVA